MKMKIVCGGKELRSLGRGTYSHTEQDSYDIGKGVRCSLGKACGNTALTEQVAEEEHTEQWNTRGYHEASEQHTDNREDNLLVLRHGASRFHLDKTLFLVVNKRINGG